MISTLHLFLFFYFLFYFNKKLYLQSAIIYIAIVAVIDEKNTISCKYNIYFLAFLSLFIAMIKMYVVTYLLPIINTNSFFINKFREINRNKLNSVICSSLKKICSVNGKINIIAVPFRFSSCSSHQICFFLEPHSRRVCYPTGCQTQNWSQRNENYILRDHYRNSLPWPIATIDPKTMLNIGIFEESFEFHAIISFSKFES